MFKKMSKKIFHWKTILVSMSAIAVLFVAMVFFNSAVSEVIYSKIFPGNVLFKGNIYVADHPNGGNQGATTSITGLPKLKLVALGTMTNASTETVLYLDDAETDWTAINTRVTAYAGATGDTDIYRVGASSLRLTFSGSVIGGDGAIYDVADDNLENKDSIGFWIYSSENLQAGDFYIELVDATSVTDYTVNVPAIFKRIWTWVECDISGIPNPDGDDVTVVNFKMSATGATNLPAVDIYLDGMYAWAVADEEALGVNIVTDGVISVLMSIEASGADNVTIQAVEHTNYFTHYEATNDFIVGITDNDNYDGLAFVAYK